MPDHKLPLGPDGVVAAFEEYDKLNPFTTRSDVFGSGYSQGSSDAIDYVGKQDQICFDNGKNEAFRQIAEVTKVYTDEAQDTLACRVEFNADDSCWLLAVDQTGTMLGSLRDAKREEPKPEPRGKRTPHPGYGLTRFFRHASGDFLGAGFGTYPEAEIMVYNGTDTDDNVHYIYDNGKVGASWIDGDNLTLTRQVEGGHLIEFPSLLAALSYKGAVATPTLTVADTYPRYFCHLTGFKPNHVDNVVCAEWIGHDNWRWHLAGGATAPYSANSGNAGGWNAPLINSYLKEGVWIEVESVAQAVTVNARIKELVDAGVSVINLMGGNHAHYYKHQTMAFNERDGKAVVAVRTDADGGQDWVCRDGTLVPVTLILWTQDEIDSFIRDRNWIEVSKPELLGFLNQPALTVNVSPASRYTRYFTHKTAFVPLETSGRKVVALKVDPDGTNTWMCSDRSLVLSVQGMMPYSYSESLIKEAVEEGTWTEVWSDQVEDMMDKPADEICPCISSACRYFVHIHGFGSNVPGESTAYFLLDDNKVGWCFNHDGTYVHTPSIDEEAVNIFCTGSQPWIEFKPRDQYTSNELAMIYNRQGARYFKRVAKLKHLESTETNYAIVFQDGSSSWFHDNGLQGDANTLMTLRDLETCVSMKLWEEIKAEDMPTYQLPAENAVAVPQNEPEQPSGVTVEPQIVVERYFRHRLGAFEDGDTVLVYRTDTDSDWLKPNGLKGGKFENFDIPNWLQMQIDQGEYIEYASRHAALSNDPDGLVIEVMGKLGITDDHIAAAHSEEEWDRVDQLTIAQAARIKTLLALLKQCHTDNGAMAWQNDKLAWRRLLAINEAVDSAIGLPPVDADI